MAAAQRRICGVVISYGRLRRRRRQRFQIFRNGWGNNAPAVTAAEIAKLRKATDPSSDRVILLKMR